MRKLLLLPLLALCLCQCNLVSTDKKKDTDKTKTGEWSDDDIDRFKKKFDEDAEGKPGKKVYECTLEKAQELFADYDELRAVERKSKADRTDDEQDKFKQLDKASADCAKKYKDGDDDKTGDDKGGGSWSSSDIRKLKEKLIGGNKTLSAVEEKRLDCMVEKVQSLYKDFDEASAAEDKDKTDRTASEEEKHLKLNAMIKACGKEYPDDGDKDSDDDDDKSSGGDWSSSDIASLKAELGRQTIFMNQPTLVNCIIDDAQRLFSNYAEMERVSGKTEGTRTNDENSRYNKMLEDVKTCTKSYYIKR